MSILELARRLGQAACLLPLALLAMPALAATALPSRAVAFTRGEEPLKSLLAARGAKGLPARAQRVNCKKLGQRRPRRSHHQAGEVTGTRVAAAFARP